MQQIGIYEQLITQVIEQNLNINKACQKAHTAGADLIEESDSITFKQGGTNFTTRRCTCH